MLKLETVPLLLLPDLWILISSYCKQDHFNSGNWQLLSPSPAAALASPAFSSPLLCIKFLPIRLIPHMNDCHSI